jgi:D-hydroxyproline dehydrogenase
MVRDASSAAVTTMSKEAKKVGVIGAGIIGIVVASCLQRGGHEVFVVDPNEPAKGASFGNAGIFGTSWGGGGGAQ